MALPPHTLNRQFVDDFIEADAPCCALGLVRSGDTQTGLFAMKPDGALPAGCSHAKRHFRVLTPSPGI